MSTMHKPTVDRLIAGNGWLPEHPDHDAPDNPRAAMIVEYTDQGGGQAFGVTFESEPAHRRERYLVESPYIRNPKIVWEPSDDPA